MRLLLRWMPLVAVLALAFNLRIVAVSVGPVLGAIMADYSMGGGLAGLLTSMPALCFAIFGALAPMIARRLGNHITVSLALLCLIVGQTARIYTDSTWQFLAFSVLALAGMAVGNVMLPTLVRHHFPSRIALATSLYSLSLSLGLTLASVGTVPLAMNLGGWRGAFTALTVLAVAAFIIWLPMLRRQQSHVQAHSTQRRYTIAEVASTRRGWAMALFFALQSAQGYTIFGWLPTVFVDAGLSELHAGLMLGITNAVGIVPAFLVPAWVGRMRRPTRLFLSIVAFLTLGYLGLMLAPMAIPWLWSIFIAFGLSAFPLFLALLATRAATPSGTAALSGFAQSMGYLLAAAGPLIVGIVHEQTAGWTIPLLLQLAEIVPFTFLGAWLCQEWNIETEISAKAP